MCQQRAVITGEPVGTLTELGPWGSAVCGETHMRNAPPLPSTATRLPSFDLPGHVEKPLGACVFLKESSPSREVAGAHPKEMPNREAGV